RQLTAAAASGGRSSGGGTLILRRRHPQPSRERVACVAKERVWAKALRIDREVRNSRVRHAEAIHGEDHPAAQPIGEIHLPRDEDVGALEADDASHQRTVGIAY